MSQIKSMVDVLNASGSFSANSEVVIAGPAIHLAEMKKTFRPDIATCAEDVGFKTGYGAMTGEMSAEMLVDSGISWTLTGHSERRVGFGFAGETSHVVGVKTKNAIDAGMSVMACIGEQLEDRQNGSTMAVCAEQLEAIKAALEMGDWKKVVIAYEPVWAIGTGLSATPEMAQETHAQVSATPGYSFDVSNEIVTHYIDFSDNQWDICKKKKWVEIRLSYFLTFPACF